jgi:hypothetical protein
LRKALVPALLAVHQCARFSSILRYEHGKATKQIGRYLLATKDKGIECTPTSNGLECYADANFSGNWDEQLVPFDNSTLRSGTGYIIRYSGMPIAWASRLQTEGAHS